MLDIQTPCILSKDKTHEKRMSPDNQEMAYAFFLHDRIEYLYRQSSMENKDMRFKLMLEEIKIIRTYLDQLEENINTKMPLTHLDVR